MPMKAPRICGCGHRVAAGLRCPCEAKQAADRKARFDQKRPNSSQRGYNGTWDLRKTEYLVKNPVCVKCGAAANTVDHIIPHKGDMGLFWDIKHNWQSLCGRCHNSGKQREERLAQRSK